MKKVKLSELGINPKEYGIGGPGQLIEDCNNYLPTAIYKADSSTLNRAENKSGQILNIRMDASTAWQLYFIAKEAQIYFRAQYSSGWTSWVLTS